MSHSLTPWLSPLALCAAEEPTRPTTLDIMGRGITTAYNAGPAPSPPAIPRGSRFCCASVTPRRKATTACGLPLRPQSPRHPAPLEYPQGPVLATQASERPLTSKQPCRLQSRGRDRLPVAISQGPLLIPPLLHAIFLKQWKDANHWSDSATKTCWT